MKTTFALLILFVVVLGGGYLISRHGQSSAESYAAPTTYSDTASGASSTTVSTTDATTSTTVKTTTASSYTLAQVATHAKATDCWATISGSVYNLTSWVSQHPGGEANILKICGKDGTSLFDGQHGSDPRAMSILATFKIGALSS